MPKAKRKIAREVDRPARRHTDGRQEVLDDVGLANQPLPRATALGWSGRRALRWALTVPSWSVLAWSVDAGLYSWQFAVVFSSLLAVACGSVVRRWLQTGPLPALAGNVQTAEGAGLNEEVRCGLLVEATRLQDDDGFRRDRLAIAIRAGILAVNLGHPLSDAHRAILETCAGSSGSAWGASASAALPDMAHALLSALDAEASCWNTDVPCPPNAAAAAATVNSLHEVPARHRGSLQIRP